MEAVSILQESIVTEEQVLRLMENNKQARKQVPQRKNSMAMEQSFSHSRLSQRRRGQEWDEPASSGMTTPSVQNVRNPLPVSYIMPKNISDFVTGGRLRARLQHQQQQ
jgi:hypothetical protein